MIWQFSEMGNAETTKNSNGGNDTDPKIVNWNLLNEPNHKGLYDSYCELIAIRRSNADLFSKDAAFSMNCGASNWTAGRTMTSRKGGKELYTVINPKVSGSITVNVSFTSKNNDSYAILSKSYDSSPSFNASAGTVTVPANCYVVIGTKDVSTGIDDMMAEESSSIKAYSEGGVIYVEGAGSVVEIYSVEGMKIGEIHEEGSISAAPGVYILKTPAAARKLIVR